MFPKIIKLILALVSLTFSAHQFIEQFIGNGIALALLGGMFVLLYFKNELIFLAFIRLRKEDLNGAKKWLDKIKNPPSSLVKKQHGYYLYLYGLIESQNNLHKAEKFLKSALDLGLRYKHDQAMAKMNLAGILMQKRRKREANKLLSEAKRLDKHGMLTQQIKMLRTQLKKF
ncbi:MAG: DUF2892 domain-containing protein [Flavobacteriaceae bacterium]|nr:DUF2892 domain-containing protein [Flavobacteriaceae bacterium]